MNHRNPVIILWATSRRHGFKTLSKSWMEVVNLCNALSVPSQLGSYVIRPKDWTLLCGSKEAFICMHVGKSCQRDESRTVLHLNSVHTVKADFYFDDGSWGPPWLRVWGRLRRISYLMNTLMFQSKPESKKIPCVIWSQWSNSSTFDNDISTFRYSLTGTDMRFPLRQGYSVEFSRVWLTTGLVLWIQR